MSMVWGVERSYFVAEAFVAGSASGEAENARTAAIHNLSSADDLRIVKVVAAAQRTRPNTSETHCEPRASWPCLAAAESLIFSGARGSTRS